MIKVSAAVTTYNNENTIKQCLNSLSFCDEIVVLDSFSDDRTEEFSKGMGCIWHQREFNGYAEQKQSVIDLCKNEWVLLLDSDEFIDSDSINVIKSWMNQTHSADAFCLPRREYVFWKWSHPWVHKNKFVRLFRKSRAKMSDHIVHESVVSKGQTKDLNVIINHYNETSIQKKIGKINKYSTLSANEKFQSGKRSSVLKIILSPPFYFFKQLILRRQILNGFAGWINASLNTYYAFLKYVKLYELEKNKD